MVDKEARERREFYKRHLSTFDQILTSLKKRYRKADLQDLLGFSVTSSSKYSDRDQLNIWYGILTGVRMMSKIADLEEELKVPDDNSHKFLDGSKKERMKIHLIIATLKIRFPRVNLELVSKIPPRIRRSKLKDRDDLVRWFGIIAGMRMMLDIDPTIAKQLVLDSDCIRNKGEISDVVEFFTFEHERKMYPDTFLL